MYPFVDRLFRPGPDAPPQLRPWAFFALAALVALVHAAGLVGPLVFDDEHAVRDNPAIRELANVPAFFVDPDLFSATAGRMYRPLVLTTLAVDHAIGGGAAWAFRLGNLLQHVAASLLLLWSLPRLFARARVEARWIPAASVCAALLFALHPLHVESLCLVSSRSEILMAIGLLIALRSAVVTTESPRGRILQYAGVAVGTAWACLSKETGVLVPPFILFLLLATGPGARTIGSRILDSVRAIGPACLVALAYLVLRKQLFGVATTGVRSFVTGGDPYAGGSRDLQTQLVSMTQFLPKAVGLWLFPGDLSLDHTRFDGWTVGDPTVWLGAAVILLPLALALLWWRKRPVFAISVCGAFGFALPWILVPLNVPLAEHRLYVPVLTLSIAAGLGLVRLTELAVAKRLPRPALRYAPAFVLALLATRSVIREFAWHDQERLWTVTLQSNDKSFRALCGLSDVAWERGELRLALSYLERAERIYARYLPARRNLCELRVRIGEHDGDAAECAETVRIVEDFAMQRWKDPFVRLQASRARLASFRHTQDPADQRIARSWALSCLAMVERKMLVYLQASEAEKRAGNHRRALALFDVCREHGLENTAFLVAMGECLIEARAFDEARRLLAELCGETVRDRMIFGFAMKLAAATGDRKLHAWAKSGALQASFGVAAPAR